MWDDRSFDARSYDVRSWRGLSETLQQIAGYISLLLRRRR
jgi:hypothetical protein